MEKQKNNIVPIFSSQYSIGKSTLTLDKPEDINVNRPISIFSMAKHYKLSEVFLVDNRIGGFIEAYENSKKAEVPLRFGIKLVVCNDINEKTEESLKTEHKVIVWLKNTKNAAASLNRIYSKAWTDGFYYCGRIDMKNLLNLWDDDLKLSIPSYSSFLHNNLLKGHQCVVDFYKLKPTIMWSDMNLPFDSLIKETHINYAKNNNLELQEIHPIRFFDKKRFYSYNVFRCIANRSLISKPQLDQFGSKEFNFESYMNKIGKTI